MQGTLGDINFYKSQHGYLIREKGGVNGNRIKKDPVFQRTRENGMEFGRAARAGKLLRTAVRSLVRALAELASALRLHVAGLEATTLIELTAFGTAVAMHWRYQHVRPRAARGARR